MRRVKIINSSFWIRVFGVISLLFFLAVFGIKCISPFMYLPLVYSCITYAIMVLVFILLFCFKKPICKALIVINDKFRNTNRLKLLAIIFFLSFVPKFICGVLWGIDSRNVNVDIYIYQNIAKELSSDGIVTTYAEYCNVYPHLLWFGSFLVPVVKIFGHNQTALCIFFDLLLSISSVLLCDAFLSIFSKAKVFIAVVLYSLLPSTILLPQFIIHEIPYLFFFSLSIWVYFIKIHKIDRFQQRVLFMFLFIIFVSFATMINACGYIACIAFAVNLVFFEKQSKFLFRFIKALLLIILVLFIQLGTSNFVKPLLISDKHLSTPKFNVIQWTLFVGSNAESNGGFTGEDQNKFAWSFTDFNTLDEKGWTDEDVLAQRDNYFHERMNSMVQKPFTTIKLCFIKFGKIWSFLNYTYYALPPLINDMSFRDFYSDLLMPILILIEIVISVILLICSIRNFRKTDCLECGIYRFSVLYLMGCTCLFLLIECNSKYTISLHPLFWIVVTLNTKKPKFFDFLNHKDMKKVRKVKY